MTTTLVDRILPLFVDMPPDDGLTIRDVWTVVYDDGGVPVTYDQVGACLRGMKKRGLLIRGAFGTPDAGLYMPAMAGEEAA